MRISDGSSDGCFSDLHGAKRRGRHRVEGGGAAGTAALDLALLHGGSVGWRLEDNHVTFNSWRQTHADAAFNAAGNCARWSRAGALPAQQGAAPDRAVREIGRAHV